MKNLKLNDKQKNPQPLSFTRRDFLSKSLKVGAATFTTGLFPHLRAKAKDKYNVLFIMVDDLRPMLGCYGMPEMFTPNIDRLAEKGTLFNRAYCQFPVCNPSRASILTGLRPDTTRVLNNDGNLHLTVPDAITLPHHFKNHGYHTRSVGKIAHGSTVWFDQDSWSEPLWKPSWTYINKQTSPSWQALDVDDEELDDGRIANVAVEVMKEINDLTFFLAVGFNKPHLPFYAPRKYFDLYTTDFNLPVISRLPKNAPTIALNRKTLQAYQDIEDKAPFADEKTLELIRAYAANVSFVDAQVGRVLDQLEMLNLSENTVIVFCGDHGFQLGEHGMWRKSTLFEVCLQSPLIVCMPEQEHRGVSVNALTELVDIYPTLCHACDVPIPDTLEGTSMLPIIKQPADKWKAAAFSQYRRGDIDGYTIRTDRYRYTEWGNNGRSGIELYDYDIDPHETENVAEKSDYSDVMNQLSKKLHAGWQAALPEMIPQNQQTNTLKWDVNDDGIVDIQDLSVIANNFNKHNPENRRVDVNMDGVVDIIDLLLVAAHLGESSNGKSPKQVSILAQDISNLEKWISEARISNDSSPAINKGIANLETLMNSVLPKASKLLPNFPNPFNPETWIPYDLASDTDVSIQIYNIRGESVRHLKLGFQTVGTYRSQTRAAHWDGRNSLGESVASGIYFYTLNAGKYQATRKLVVTK